MEKSLQYSKKLFINIKFCCCSFISSTLCAILRVKNSEKSAEDPIEIVNIKFSRFSSASKLFFESNERVALRMAHKVEEMKKQ